MIAPRTLLAVVMLTLSIPAIGAPPKVLATIAPVHSLVSGVMQGVSAPELLLSADQSPHHYSLRPSQARALLTADLVVWIGSEVEGFLTETLRTHGIRALALIESPGLRIHRRVGHTESSSDEHDHVEATRDGHIWLDPLNAAVMTKSIAEELARIDPDNAGIYAANSIRLRQRLEELDQTLAIQLAPLAGRSAFVSHDAYRYLTLRYGLAPSIPVVDSPEIPPGVKKVRRLLEEIRAEQPRCVFTEPQAPAAVINRLAESVGAKMVVLDPLGSRIPPGENAYFLLMRHLAAALTDCLASPTNGNAEK